MCVISMVHDHYEPLIPKTNQFDWSYLIEPPWVVDLRKLISEFKEAIEAAKKVDILTSQPDCIDPEKAKLQDRVKELEKKISEVRKAVDG